MSNEVPPSKTSSKFMCCTYSQERLPKCSKQDCFAIKKLSATILFSLLVGYELIDYRLQNT